MARPKKAGLDYFPQNCDIHNDRNIRKLLAKYNANGYLIFDYIKAYCFNGNGYWLRYTDDFCFDTADRLGCDITTELVKEVIEYCLELGLFDGDIFCKYQIITSAEFQRIYLFVKRNGIIDEKIRVITVETPVIEAETPVVAAESTQRKVKKSKEKESTPTPSTPSFSYVPPARVKPTAEQVQEYFFQQQASPDSATRFFNKYDGLDWMNGITPIANWRAFANMWIADSFGIEKKISGTHSPAVNTQQRISDAARLEQELKKRRGA